MDAPVFPFDLLHAMAPPGLVERFSAAELGVFFRLLAHSWRQTPPCSLPDATEALAAVAGVTPAEWQGLTRLALTFTRPGDGRVHFQEARVQFDRLQSDARRRRDRTAAATAAAAASRREGQAAVRDGMRATPGPTFGRTHDRPERPSRIRNGSVTDPLRTGPIASIGTRARAERSAPLRSPPPDEFQRSLGAQSAEVIARVGGDGARALIETKIREWRRSQATALLLKTLEEWRAAGRSTVPLSKAHELAAGPYSTPARVESVLCRVAGLLATKDCRSPVGYVIAALGLGEHGAARLMEPDLVLAAKWDQQEAVVASRLAVVAATAAALQERRGVVRGTGEARAAGA